MRRARRDVHRYVVAGLVLAVGVGEVRILYAHPEWARAIFAGASLGWIGLAGGVVAGAALIVYRRSGGTRR